MLLLGSIYPATQVHAADTYTVTYINNGATTVKTYNAGAVTLDPLPSGAIAWTDDNEPSVPNNKMAYVGYDNQITINRNMTLRADYGSYATGPGPRLIQFHLELKYYEADVDAFLEFQQQYANMNAPAGYYIHLPNENFFDPIEFTAAPPVDLQDDLHIHKWVYDASYTGTTTVDPLLLHDPSSLIFVDPNNYNQIYNVMVDPNFTVTEPTPGADPVVLPSLLPRHAVQFTVSQKDLPVGGGFTVDGTDYIYDDDPLNDTSTNVYMQRPVDSLLWAVTFSNSPVAPYDYDLLPVPVDIPGYTWEWSYDGGSPSPDDIVADGDSLHVTASHHYVLQYVPDTPLIPVVVTADRQEFVWDGQPHSASGYTVDGLVDDDQLVFQPRSLLATTSVTGTDVGTYPLIMSFRDFRAVDTGNNSVLGKYTISVVGGGLTITPVPLGAGVDPVQPTGPGGSVHPPNTGLPADSILKYVAALSGGIALLAGIGSKRYLMSGARRVR